MIVQGTNLFRRFGLLAIACSVAMLCAFVATAHASSSLWGELGSGAHLEGIELAHTTSFAVDSGDGSFYVADETKTGALPEFRIQRFSPTGSLEASVSFTPPEAKKTSTGIAGEEIQLAVDPTRNRVYALIVYRRREINEKEEKELEKEEELLEKEGKKCGPGTCYERFPLDSEELAAGELYGFLYKGGKLVPAKETSEGAAPIAGENAFNAQGEAPKEALLNPRGMAVEPASGDVAITGDEDEEEDLKVEKSESEQKCRAVAQFVNIQENKGTGELTGKPGNRYVDNHEVLEESACEKGENEELPYSPIISSGGKLFAEEVRSSCPKLEECLGGEVWELPKSSDQIGETAGVKEFATAPRFVYGLAEKQELLAFGPEGVVGPTMSYVPNSEGSSEGKIYLEAEALGRPGSGEPPNGAVLVLGYTEAAGKEPEAKEIGWTGGGHEAGGTQGCLIPRPSSQAFLVGGFKEAATGKEGVVAFDAFEQKKEAFIEALEFGPGGSTTGCPHVSATPPSVKVKGVTVTKLVPGEVASFESTIEAANAESVEWKFENTTTKKVETESGGYEFQTTSLTHAFTEEGSYKVTEIIQPDNLSSSTIEVALASDLIVKTRRPEFEITTQPSFAKGEDATFEASILDENKQTTPFKYVWKFGDGEEEKGETSGTIISAKHVYSSLCASCTVTLEVTDKEGTTGTATVVLAVRMDKAEEEAKRAEEEKRKAEEAAKHKAEEEAAAKRKAEEAAKHKAEEEAKEKAGGGTTKAPEANPEAKLAGTTLSVTSAGALAIKVTCPGGETSCIGTVTLRTLSAVSAGAHKKKKTILTLASGSFDVAGGQVKIVTLHLSASARGLLAHSHVLRVRATLLAHNPSGASHTTTLVLTLRLAKATHGHKH